jgi:hypothetical protein
MMGLTGWTNYCVERYSMDFFLKIFETGDPETEKPLKTSLNIVKDF